MDPVGPNATTTDFYDRFNDNPGRLILRVGLVFLWMTFFVTAFFWVNDSFFLLLSVVMGPAILFTVPRLLRDTYLAYRGTPALRINQLGFWAREWSYLGWISWGDVASVEIEGKKIHTLTVVLRDKGFARLAGHDQASIMLTRLGQFLFFTDVGPNRLRLINSTELASRWERLTAALDPILATNRIPLSVSAMNA